MKISEVTKMVEHIKEISNDDEMAHSAEDGLYITVLEEIAKGTKNAQKLAAEALKARDIDFARLHA